MATASASATNAPPEPLTVGVCFPVELSDAEVRRALRLGGHTIAFWHAEQDAAIEACLAGEVDVFLLGVRRLDPRVLECVDAVVKTRAEAKVVLACKRSGEGDVRKVLDAGARALVPLSEIEGALLPVIEVVRAGQVSVPGSRRKEAGKKVLTAREKQILGQVVLGMTNAEIAAKLFLAESTIKSHLSSAFAKLGVTSRNEASALILDPTAGVGLGILTIPSQKITVSG